MGPLCCHYLSPRENTPRYLHSKQSQAPSPDSDLIYTAGRYSGTDYRRTSIDSGKIQAELLVSISDLLSQHGMALQTSSSGGDFTLVPFSDASASGLAPIATGLISRSNYSPRPSQPRSSLDAPLPDLIAFQPASSAVWHANAYPDSQPVPTHTAVRRRSTSRGQKRSRSRSPDREWNRSSLAYPETGFMAHRQPSIGPSPIRFEYNIPSNLSVHSVSNSALSTHPHLGALDDEFVPRPHEESHGTLVLGKSGRSRYLGPTAGPEWLKDVRFLPGFGLMRAR